MRDGQETTTFESFFIAEFPRLVSMLTAWSGSRATAEDLAQDALMRAESEWERIRTFDNPGTWVRRAAINRSHNERRRLGRQRRALERIDTQPTASEPTTPDDELWSAVRTLPDKQRAAVVLHHVDDLPLTDIATVLECSVGTVKTHLQRGRKRLAAVLDEETNS